VQIQRLEPDLEPRRAAAQLLLLPLPLDRWQECCLLVRLSHLLLGQLAL
jgi:hypothetical protein